MAPPRLPPGWGGPKEGYTSPAPKQTPQRLVAATPYTEEPQSEAPSGPIHYPFAPPPDPRLHSTTERLDMIRSKVPTLDFTKLRGGHRKPAAPVALAALKGLAAKKTTPTPTVPATMPKTTDSDQLAQAKASTVPKSATNTPMKMPLQPPLVAPVAPSAVSSQAATASSTTTALPARLRDKPPTTAAAMLQQLADAEAMVFGKQQQQQQPPQQQQQPPSQMKPPQRDPPSQQPPKPRPARKPAGSGLSGLDFLSRLEKVEKMEEEIKAELAADTSATSTQAPTTASSVTAPPASAPQEAAQTDGAQPSSSAAPMASSSSSSTAEPDAAAASVALAASSASSSLTLAQSAPPPPSNFSPMTPLKKVAGQPKAAWPAANHADALAKGDDNASSANDLSDIESVDHASSSATSAESAACTGGASVPARRHTKQIEASGGKGTPARPRARQQLNLDAVAHTVSPQRSNLLGGNAFESRLTGLSKHLDTSALLQQSQSQVQSRARAKAPSPQPGQKTAQRGGSPMRPNSPIARKQRLANGSPGRLGAQTPLRQTPVIGAGGGNRFRGT